MLKSLFLFTSMIWLKPQLIAKSFFIPIKLVYFALVLEENVKDVLQWPTLIKLTQIQKNVNSFALVPARIWQMAWFISKKMKARTFLWHDLSYLILYPVNTLTFTKHYKVNHELQHSNPWLPYRSHLQDTFNIQKRIVRAKCFKEVQLEIFLK